MTPCWFQRFFPGSGTPCPNEGRWRGTENEILAKMTWCDEHKHPNDVPLDGAA